jgi:hypothetical protein
MRMGEQDRVALAAEAFIYGYPLVADLEQVVRYTTAGAGVLPPAPFNRFGHGARLAGPEDTFVSINNDTVYSFAQLDLGAGPQLLQVPEVGDRYYVLQFIDAWTNNFAYLGTRATGSGPGRFLIAPPGWAGQLPAGATRITSPTRICSIIGRLAVQGEADLPAVRALQEQLVLTPLDPDAADPQGVPEPDPAIPDELAFYERLRIWMQAFPPSPAEQEHQQRFAPLGLLEGGASPYAKASSELAGELTAGLAAGRERLEEIARAGSQAKINGWHTALHACDYNLDWFEVGTIDDPAWKLQDRAQAHVGRAMVARGGLWGNHGYEACYYIVFEDADGQQLHGANRYRVRFDQPPPAQAFWSITMYDMPDYFLVANPIDRYSIGDRTPGLHYGEDGSLTITIQHDQPEDGTERANWLPAPEGDFRPALRIYNPRQEVLDGRYEPPPITPARTRVRSNRGGTVDLLPA